jgi:hypothetical protein
MRYPKFRCSELPAGTKKKWMKLFGHEQIKSGAGKKVENQQGGTGEYE